MTVDFKTFLTITPHIIKAKYPVLIRGRHGIGKSELVYQIAEQLGMPVVERRVSNMTEGDLLGLPSIEGKTTTWNPPDFYLDACTNPVILFLDEVDRGTPEVAQQIFEMTDSRKLNGHELHRDTLIFAAVNGGEHASNYHVRDMDPAELDRWTTIDVEPTCEDWLTWASGKIPSVVWEFISHNNSHLEHKEDFEPNKKYPSRRSWVRFGKTLDKAGLGKILSEEMEARKPVVMHLAAGFLGFEAAVSFADFYENYREIVSAEAVIKKGHYRKTESWDMHQHIALIEEIAQNGYFRRELDGKELRNLADYWISVHTKFSEAAMKMMFTMGSGDGDDKTQKICDSNFIKFGSLENKSGDSISELIAIMLSTKQ